MSTIETGTPEEHDEWFRANGSYIKKSTLNQRTIVNGVIKKEIKFREKNGTSSENLPILKSTMQGSDTMEGIINEIEGGNGLR